MDFYKTKFWGYSLPLYLSATLGCHPNYAIYYAGKDSLNVKAFNELLKSISLSDRQVFSKEKAEYYYIKYQEKQIDDSKVLTQLYKQLHNKKIIILAPGKNLKIHSDIIKKEIECKNSVAIAVNFDAEGFDIKYIFSSNMRRFTKINRKLKVKIITTSNMQPDKTDYVINFSSYISKYPEIIDNAGLMILKLLATIGIKEVFIAGMDGYSIDDKINYLDKNLEFDFSKGAKLRNKLISCELKEISKIIKIHFLTPTIYDI